MKNGSLWLKAKDKLTPYESVKWLWLAFTYAGFWKTAHYDKIDADQRKEFSDMVKVGDLYDCVENLKRLCLAHSVELSNRILAETCLLHIDKQNPLPEAERIRLHSYTDELLPIMCRLEVLQAHQQTGIVCEDGSRSVRLNGKEIASKLDPVAYKFFKAVADGKGDVVKGTSILALPGMSGKKLKRDAINKLPEELQELISGVQGQGYHLTLP